MKRTIIVAIVSVLFFSIITNNSYAESLYVDAQLGELKKIENSKYKATALNVVRNSDGELISVVKTVASRYLADPITDQYLDTLEVIKRGNVNGQIVKMMQVTIHLNFEECKTETKQTSGFISSCNEYSRPFVNSLVVSDKNNDTYEIFRGLNNNYVIKPTDTVTSYWTIISSE